jgi:ribulose-bisphosphate carboxylase small chain
MSAGIFATPVARPGFVGLKSKSSNLRPNTYSIEWKKKDVSNGSRIHCMKVK